jgi:hypothetical protein
VHACALAIGDTLGQVALPPPPTRALGSGLASEDTLLAVLARLASIGPAVSFNSEASYSAVPAAGPIGAAQVVSRGVFVLANDTNTAIVGIGGPTVTPANAIRLLAGQSTMIEVDNVSKVFALRIGGGTADLRIAWL